MNIQHKINRLNGLWWLRKRLKPFIWAIFMAARVLIEKNNRYLLQTEERGGQLSLPGGRVKNKEFIRKGLVREILEETNLKISKHDLQLVHTQHRKEVGEVEIIFFFKVLVENIDELNLNEPQKFQEFVWMPKEKMNENLIPEFQVALTHIQKGNIFSEYPKKQKP
jgi:ADP-ribose pyrophosphatase YjhB (NUDIX family)